MFRSRIFHSLSHQRRGRDHRGLTLIEVLVALAMTLIVLGAMITAFQYASAEISKGRARIEMSNQLRVVQDLLRADLDGLTVEVRPWSRTSAPPGYFEYVEGYLYDGWWNQDPSNVVNNIVGDVDDILALTTRCDEKPFRGRLVDYSDPNLPISTVESNIAEVVWWTDGRDTINYNLPTRVFRRVLLIRPDLPVRLERDWAGVIRYFLLNDISANVRWDSALNRYVITPNALGDLGRRENRFAHMPLFLVNPPLPGPQPINRGFPHLLDRDFLRSMQLDLANFAQFPTGPQPDPLIPYIPEFHRTFIGQDALLSNVLAFDLKAFSVNSVLEDNNGIVVQPGDLGYVPPQTLPQPGIQAVDRGAYVDLGYGFQTMPPMAPPVPPPALPFPVSPSLNFDDGVPDFAGRPTRNWFLHCLAAGYSGYDVFVYDTFTTAYESDGIDQDRILFLVYGAPFGDYGPDQATNGLDDDGANGVDDEGERETVPPYPFSMSGLKVTIRAVEPTSRQVVEVGVVSSFLPK